jgi:hypothetical protein
MLLIACYHINSKNIEKAIKIGICLNNDHFSLISIKHDLEILTSNPIHRPNYIGELGLHTLEIMDIDPCKVCLSSFNNLTRSSSTPISCASNINHHPYF